MTRSVGESPRAAAWAGLALGLPMPALLAIAVLKIQPWEGWLRSWKLAGLLLLAGSLLMLPAGAWISLRPVWRGWRAGQGTLTHPMNVVVGVAAGALFVGLVGVMVADQWPCWMGEANCD